MSPSARSRRPLAASLRIACCVLALASAPVLAPAIHAQTSAASQTSSTPTQLPDVARPTHYAVSIVPDIANLRFDGHVTINIDVLKATKVITLNAADMTFTSAGLVGGAKASVSLDKDKETATLTFATALKPGKARIELRYSGIINRQANGLFALDYKDVDGKDARSLFTQFEPADARRVFPGWDEPGFKTSFDLAVTVPAGQMAVGNMPVATRKPAGKGLEIVTFQTTPKMSTYLFFFAVGDMERITTKAGKTEIGIVTSRGQSGMAQFALESEARLVPYYNDYFGVDFPLPKLDTVGGPGRSQFFGAMENWGAIFTFEYALINDPKLTTPDQYQNIFIYGAHETAHQWFGDLVTMKWWGDLWLNEGFASWMEGKATAHFFPEWEADLTRVSDRERAMALDARITTHPVIQEIETVAQMNQAFDAISYQKGQAVITMLEGFAGEDVWRNGLRLYMKRHAYANTETNDLWQAMEDSGAKGLARIAHDFTMQPGIPLIRVTGARCTDGTTQLTLAQGEFSSDRKDKTDATPLRWHIPVAAQSLDGKAAHMVLADGAGTLAVPGCGAVLLNAGQSSYYRTLYTPEQLAGLRAGFAKLQPRDQLGLVSDQFALSSAGYQPMSAALDLLSLVGAGSSTKLQDELVPKWTGLYGLFNDDPAAQAALAKQVTTLYAPSLARLGYAAKPGEPLLDTALRGRLISALGTIGDAGVRAEAKRLFAALDTDPAALDGPLRQTWLGVIARNADMADWEKLRAMANKANSALERSALFQLLSRARDPKIARAALDLALTSEPGQTISATIVSGTATAHPDLTLDFALSHIDQVEALVDSSGRAGYIAKLATESRDPAVIEKLRTYARDRLPEASRRAVDQTINLLEARARLEPTVRAGVKDWLATK